MSLNITGRFNALRDYTGTVAWTSFVQLARSACLTQLDRMKVGKLEIVDSTGETSVCGGCDAGPQARIEIHKEIFWLRLAVFGDLGFADSYLLAEVSCSDLVSFFKIFVVNRAYISEEGTITASLSKSLTAVLRKTNTLTNARANIAAHYDISNEMFAAFLSPDMTYSCPIWLPKSDPQAAQEPLEEAQDRKLARFIRNARIKRGDRVLEIGTGWGSFAIKAVRETGCKVTSLTLSNEQKELAEDRIEEAGLSDSIKVLLCDYRNLQVPDEGPFDKLVSIEMLEAVGREYLNVYFECVDKLLKKDGGVAVFQSITIPEARYENYAKGDDFIRRYIFPGGHLPSVSQLVASIATGSKGTLVVEQIEDIGPHYARTLRVWRENFLRSFEDQIKPALQREHEKMTKSDIDMFRRKWEYYFTYCEAGFATKTLGDHIITVGREGALEMAEDVIL